MKKSKIKIHGPRIDVPTDPPSHRPWVCYTARDRIGGVHNSLFTTTDARMLAMTELSIYHNRCEDASHDRTLYLPQQM
jgi:hypothetical protein